MGSTVSQLDKNKDVYYPDIPEDIIKGEILCRLPVKSVVRFRCVCKSWNSLLSGDPDFVKSHLTRYSMNLSNGALICKFFPYRHDPEVHPLKSRFLQLGGSVNGLVCVYHYDYECRITCVGIWNPAIHHFKNIPFPHARSKHNISFGIGFDPIANDYKVVYITIRPDLRFLAEIYSCNAGSWGKNSVKSTFLSRGHLFPYPTIIHGRIYWYNDDYTHNYIYVMVFDVQEEVFRLLRGINYYKEPGEQKIMVNLRDSLAFMFHKKFPLSTIRWVDVYIFNERCGSWTKNYTVRPITMPKSMTLRNCFPNGDLLFVSENQLKLVSVNSETHAINKIDSAIYSYDSICKRLCTLYSYGYVESLVSIQGMNIIPVERVGNDILIVDAEL